MSTHYVIYVTGTIPSGGVRLDTRYALIRRARCLTLRGAERIIRRGSPSDLIAPQPDFVAHRVERATLN